MALLQTITVDGTTYKVEGTGTSYNETKNSIALGTDTVATGENQFVFGKSNTPDTNKVEIVGGGKNSFDMYLITTSLLYTKIVAKVGTTMQDYYDYLKVKENLNLVTANESNLSTINWNLVKGIYGTGRSNNLIFLDTTSETILAGNSGYFLGFSLSISNNNLNIIFTTPISGSITSVLSVSPIDETVYKNIRTLDWQGNEYLAGKLTVNNGFEVKGSIKIGNTTLTEALVISLLGLLNTDLAS